MIGSNHPPRSLVGSASRHKLNRIDRTGETWQPELWEIYRNLGPVHYGIRFKDSAARKMDYFVAEVGEDTDEPIPTDNEQVKSALDALGSMPDIVGKMIIQINVAGEGYLVGQEESDPKWSVWSTGEINKFRASGGQRPEADDPRALTESDDAVIRIWRADPEYRSRPDSPLYSVRAQCEQLLLLNEQIGATAMSRLPAGLLFVASEFSFPTDPNEGPDTGANMDQDPFISEFIQAFTTAVTDSDSAARVAPMIVQGPFEMIEKGTKWLDFARDMDATFAQMREELLRQIAAGLDLPPEIILGLGDLNHWTGWQVDESAAKLHVDPDVLLILDGITRGYLRPALVDAGMSVEQAEGFKVWRDFSDLTSRPLSIDHGIQLLELGVISDEYMRSLANIPDDGAGDGEKRSQVNAEPPQDLREPPVIAAGALVLSDLARIDQTLAARITEGSEAAFTRAMERAGAIVRTTAKKNPQIFNAVKNVDNADLTVHLGAQRIETLQLTADQLVPADTFDPLAERLDQMLTQGQTLTRTELENIFAQLVPPDPKEAEDRDAAIAIFIAALIGAATARLFTTVPEPDPPTEFGTEIATGQMVFDLLTRAGGAPPGSGPDAPRGLALGERTRALLRDHGYKIEYETWEYGDKSLRRYPFEPHVSLDNITVPSRTDPRLGGYWPGDHRFCRCSFVPAVLPVSDGI